MNPRRQTCFYKQCFKLQQLESIQDLMSIRFWELRVDKTMATMVRHREWRKSKQGGKQKQKLLHKQLQKRRETRRKKNKNKRNRQMKKRASLRKRRNARNVNRQSLQKNINSNSNKRLLENSKRKRRPGTNWWRMALKMMINKKKMIMYLYIEANSKLREVTMELWCRRHKSLWLLMMMINPRSPKVTTLVPKSRWVESEKRKRRVVQKLKV